MKKMYIVILCVIFILLIISNNTLEEGLSTKPPSSTKPQSTTKSTANADKLIGGIRKIPFYNSLPRGLRTMIEKFISFIIFI